jgi:hypothetical protein
LCLNEVDRLIDDLTDKHAHQSPKGVMEHVAKDLGLNLVFQDTVSESRNPIIVVHERDDKDRTKTLFSLVHKPAVLYPISLLSVDYTQKWELNTGLELYDFCLEYVSSIA